MHAIQKEHFCFLMKLRLNIEDDLYGYEGRSFVIHFRIMLLHLQQEVIQMHGNSALGTEGLV